MCPEERKEAKHAKDAKSEVGDAVIQRGGLVKRSEAATNRAVEEVSEAALGRTQSTLGLVLLLAGS